MCFGKAQNQMQWLVSHLSLVAFWVKFAKYKANRFIYQLQCDFLNLGVPLLMA